MELLKYVYFFAQKSIIKAGNDKFQDLINAPRTFHIRLAVIFQIPARNNFWEAGIVMQSYMIDTVQ